jgi:hypothetical protein
MHTTTFFKLVFALLIVASVFIIGCSTNDNSVAPITQGEDIKTVPPGIFQSYPSNTLNKQLFDGGWVGPRGGEVGGKKTLNNKVEIPAGALSEKTYITVQVSSGSPGVDFGPSMKFQRPVEITLSYAGFGLTERQIQNLKIYWYNPSTGQWEKISDHPDIDRGDQTVSFETRHFSRYAWSDDEP